jgi:mitochondrial fusion and transport protein UGO1
VTNFFLKLVGLLTATVADAMTSVIQPLTHNLLLSVIPVASVTSPLLIPVLSHLTTGVLLSPLDLVRTRLIAQSSLKQYRAYTGPINALSDILREEGGFTSVYLHPQLLFPAILDNSLRPLLALALPVFLGRLFGVGDDSNPVVWSVIEFVAGCASLLITLPVETIRRRLQMQVRGNAEPLHVCVNTRRQPYYGLLDVFWSVISEETSTSSAAETESHDSAQSIWRHTSGWSQLYRGFSMGVGAGSIVMILSILGGGRQMDNGWAEL